MSLFHKDPFHFAGMPPTTNGTWLCGEELHVMNDWYIDNLGVVLCSIVVVTTFSIFWYQARNAGPKIWRSPWVFIFFGYVLMQCAAIFMFGYFMHFARHQLPPVWKEKMVSLLGCIDLWAGYWIVGQFLVLSPFVDMGCVSWKGLVKWLNYLLAVVMLCVMLYLEFWAKNPGYHNPTMHLIIDITHGLVLFGNLMTIIEVLVMRWLFSKQSLCIAVTTVLNVVALYLRFQKDSHISDSVMECIWYLFEGASLILIWLFFVSTRDLLHPSQDEYAVNGASRDLLHAI